MVTPTTPGQTFGLIRDHLARVGRARPGFWVHAFKTWGRRWYISHLSMRSAYYRWAKKHPAP